MIGELSILANAVLLAGGAAVLLLAAGRARRLLRLGKQSAHAGKWRLLLWLMLFFVVGYLGALVVVLAGRSELLAPITGLVFFGGAFFVLIVTATSLRMLSDLIDTNISRRQVGQILDSLGDAIALVDDAGRVRMANRRLGEFLGRPVGELLGRPANDVVGFDLPGAPGDGNPRLVERQLVVESAAVRPVMVVASAGDTGAVYVLKDLSAAQHRQRRLDDAARVAEEVLRVRNEFMTLVALALQEPIRNLDLTRRQAAAAATTADLVSTAGRIGAACEGLERALDGLITVARLGGSVEGASEFSPAQLVSAAAANISAVAIRTGVDVDVEIEPGVPAVFVGQGARLREILRILGEYALARVTRGQIRFAVRVVPGDHTIHQLLFSVRDDGPPLSASQTDLEVNERDPAKPALQAAYDLIIGRLLALSLGGQLTVANTPNRTVTTFLSVRGVTALASALPSMAGLLAGEPAAPATLHRLAAVAAPDAADELRREVQTGSVLLVEDNLATRELLAQQLRLGGHSVQAVSSVREALACVDVVAVDVVLLDVMLPDGTGIDLLVELRRRGALDHLSVLVISTLDETASITACLANGAEDYLPKRISPIVLRARLSACIEKQRLRRRLREQLALVAAESRRANDLLRILLPTAAADELQTTGTIVPRRYEGVAVMFADVVGFTAYCDRHPPEEVVANLRELITKFEALALEHGVQKIKTVGDAFMGAAGLFTADTRPALRCVALGRAMLALLAGHPTGWILRIGVHVGPVVGGIAGTRQFLYDIWGDTVNTAQRIEHAGRSGSVCVSSSAREQIEPDYEVRALGAVEAKGKGSLELFEVVGEGR